MTNFIQFLKNKTTSFVFNIRGVQNIDFWLTKQLLENPAVACSLKSYSYSFTQINSGIIQVIFNADYEDLPKIFSVFLAKNHFDIQTALSVALRLHRETIILVVDNRDGFISRDKDEYFKHINSNIEFVGEELQIHQLHSSTYSSRSFFNNSIIVYMIKFLYFNSTKELNDLSCLLAEQANSIRKMCLNNDVFVLNCIMHWFRNNIEYLNTDTTDDHSAVGLFKNKTAVCQGIAAYAYQLLLFCGITARYVSGDGLGNVGWGPHAWNMVFINNRWVHIDYTFELKTFSSSIIKTEKEFRKNHRWDVERYSSYQSNVVTNAKKIFRSSLIILLPEKNCYSINNCIVDATYDKKLCIIEKGVVLVAFFDIIAIYGGAFSLKDAIVYVYIEKQKYNIPFSEFKLKDNTWYTPITLLETVGVKIQLEGLSIVVKNTNR